MDENRIKELEGLSFEASLQLLESTVTKMESGQLPLDEMMNFYEEGRVLSDLCAKKLKGVERKIEILRQGAAGSAEWTDFEDDGTATRNAPAPQQTAGQPPVAPSANDEPSLF